MSLPTTTLSFAQVRAVSGTHIKYPFIEQGDSATKEYRMVCVLSQSNYNPALISLNATMSSAASAGVIALPFTADASAYFVGDFNHSPRDGGMVEFERVFSNIPASRTGVLTGTTAYTFPGIEADPNDTTLRTASGFSATTTTTTLICSNTVSVGDSVLCSLSTTSGGITVSVNGASRIALTGTSASQVVVSRLTATTTFASGSVEEYNLQPRGSAALATGTFTDFTYYLPGVTSDITVPTDVPLSETFRIEGALLGAGTVPSAVEYDIKVTNGDLLTIDSSITRYAGNIIQRANVKVKAQ